MNQRWSSAFTIIELMIVAVVIGILAAIIYVGYNGITLAASKAAAQADLQNVNTAMQLAYQETGTFPTTLPSSVTHSNGSGGGSGNGTGSGSSTLTLKWSGTVTSYGTLTDVQNGVLLSNICQDLIDEGYGKAPNQGGQVQTYITGCGNWNHGSMQVTAWSSKVWNTPVSSAQLLSYANTFTTSDTWNASQATVVKNFYTELVNRHNGVGGSFPVNSFWDSWATSNNGGVMMQALPANPTTKTGYCVETVINGSVDNIWHIDETGTLKQGAC